MLDLPTNKNIVHIIGGGLAGSEAAWQLSMLGIEVFLYEMRPKRKTAAHTGESLAELVCSNSFRSDNSQYNAIGVLHEEMRRCSSLIMQCADNNKVPAGGALAVDRVQFSKDVQATLEANSKVNIIREELTSIPPAKWNQVIIATGPLTSPNLAKAISELTGKANLAFYDSIAPIIYKESIDFSKAWFQSRHDEGDSSDYINCPLIDLEYEKFISDLLSAEKVPFKNWETNPPYFEGCLPIEVMAERGIETLAFGPMKPIGLSNPHHPDQKLRAVVQLRQDNALGTLYNLVGFQTKLRHPEQIRIFRTIPGLENAEFARLGGLHRNTFINGPLLLDSQLRLKSQPRLRFAGQITGCEGYVESAATGLLAARFAGLEVLKEKPHHPKPETALGSLLAHITGGGNVQTYQPMNINFGLFPPLTTQSQHKQRLRGKEKKAAYSKRALEQTDLWIREQPDKIKLPNP